MTEQTLILSENKLFTALRRNRKLIRDVIFLYKNDSGLNEEEFTNKVALLLKALVKVEILDEFNMQINMINRKVHINYTWPTGRESITVPVSYKEQIIKKSDLAPYEPKRNRRKKVASRRKKLV